MLINNKYIFLATERERKWIHQRKEQIDKLGGAPYWEYFDDLDFFLQAVRKESINGWRKKTLKKKQS